MADQDHEIELGDDLETLEVDTDCTHQITVKRENLHIRLHINPADVASFDDRYTLYAKGPDKKLKQVKTVRDDEVPGDDYVDLIFKNLRADCTYTLRINPGREGSPYNLFEEVPYDDLVAGGLGHDE